MTAKRTTMRTLNVHVILNGVIFRQISYDTVPYARHFLLVMRFPKHYVNKLYFELPQNIITRVISKSAAINWVTLAHHIS